MVEIKEAARVFRLLRSTTVTAISPLIAFPSQYPKTNLSPAIASPSIPLAVALPPPPPPPPTLFLRSESPGPGGPPSDAAAWAGKFCVVSQSILKF